MVTNSMLISITSNTSRIEIGGFVNFTCLATKKTDEQSIPLYRWTGPDISDYSGSVLLLRNLTFSHAGKYVCTATLTTLSITTFVDVVFQSK